MVVTSKIDNKLTRGTSRPLLVETISKIAEDAGVRVPMPTP